MTDGEAVERIWSALNGISLRTREMASGHRHDTINDFHDYKNVERTNGLLALTLALRYEDAVKARDLANSQLLSVEEEVKKNACGPSKLEEWQERLRKWLEFVKHQEDPERRSKKGKVKEPDNPYVAAEAS
ncbi:hypothetical protein EIP86_011234, partial [Pleurotus ostreatoroseus]